MTMITYRWECMFAAVSSLFTVFFAYYLWRAVYRASTTLSTQGFEVTFAYVAISVVLLVTFNTSAETNISRSIISGDVIRDIVRPLGFHDSQIAAAIGTMGLRFLLVFIPCMTVILLLLPHGMIGARNVWLFAASLSGSFIILLHIDMLTGLVAIKTEAVWGVRLAKEYIVSVFSGALIPLYLLPSSLSKVMLLLPFQGICHTPVTLLTSRSMSGMEMCRLLGMQLFWCVVLMLVVNRALKRLITKIEINGG
ncbi:MAG: hypothetical protein ABUS47_14180 [Steroidobacter sp.]